LIELPQTLVLARLIDKYQPLDRQIVGIVDMKKRWDWFAIVVIHRSVRSFAMMLTFFDRTCVGMTALSTAKQ
jgi:hypothetical protein